MVTILFVVPPLAVLGLLVAFLSRGENGRAGWLAVGLLLGLPLLVYSYRRDFRNHPGDRG